MPHVFQAHRPALGRPRFGHRILSAHSVVTRRWRNSAAAEQDEIREANAIPRLLDLLRSCMDSSSLVVTVVKALSVLAHGNHMNMETIYRLNGVPLLLEMLAPKVGPVCNAAAADLIRVLCSNELCQQNILRNQGLAVRPHSLPPTPGSYASPASCLCPGLSSLPCTWSRVRLVTVCTAMVCGWRRLRAHPQLEHRVRIRDAVSVRRFPCGDYLWNSTFVVLLCNGARQGGGTPVCSLSCGLTTCSPVQALLMTLKETTYNAAQSATVWAINALVQGQKAMLGQLLQPDTVSTLLRCVKEDNGAAPGTVRLLLVVFLHSGKHEELRTLLLGSPHVLMALLDILRKGPSVEPTKWTASLLSTLCWQENSMKDVMVELRAPEVRRCC